MDYIKACSLNKTDKNRKVPVFKKEDLTYEKELRLILQASKIGLGIEAIPERGTCKNQETIDWDRFLEMVSYHKIRPLIFKGILQLQKGYDIPDYVLNQLKKNASYFTFRNFDNTKELLRIGELLKKHNVDYIPIKGIVLSQFCFDDIGIRESSDIDVLIRKSDFQSIKDILLSENYTEELTISKFFHSLYIHLYCEYNFDLYGSDNKRLFHYEPHWYMGSKMFQTDITYEQIEPLLTDDKLFNKDVNILSPEGLIITTAIHHGYSDRWNYLKNIVDMAALMRRDDPKIDWNLTLSTCDELKIINLLLPGLYLANKCFDIPLPESVQERLGKKHIKYAMSRLDYKYMQCKNDSSTKNFFSRIYYHVKIRKHFSTKLLILYYHLLHTLCRPFITKTKSAQQN